MTFPRQISLLALLAFLGLALSGCQPSDPDSPYVKQLTSIAVTPNPVNLEIGGLASLVVTGTLTDRSTYVLNSGVTFSSNATGVASVTPDTGYITALSAGSATITATHTDSGLTATTTVVVSPLRVISIVVSPAASTLAPGASQALSVTATYNNGTTGSETTRSTFASSNTAVATVDAAGVVTAVAEGDAVITATHTASGKTATAAITVGTGGGGGTVLISFDEAPPPRLTDFGTNGAPPVIAADPVNAANKVLKVFKYALPVPGSEQWAGTTISTIYSADPADAGSIPAIPFSDSAKTMTVRVWSPAVGVRVRLKVEDASNPGISVETDAITTKSGQWETLTFDFANPGLSPPVGGGPTSPLDLTRTYNRLSIFMDFGLGNGGSGPLPADRVYYVDDIIFVGGGGGGATAPTDKPATVIPAGSVTIYSDAVVTAGFDPFPNWGQNPPVTSSEVTIAGNKSLKYVWAGPGGLYQGLDWSSSPVDVSGKTKLHIDFWTPDVTSVKVSIISPGPVENAYTQVLTTGNWNSVDVDLSNFIADTASIIQIKLEPATPGTLYVDNIYFWGTSGGGGGGSGSTGTCAPTNCTDFSGGGIGFGVFENPGGGTVELAEDPNDPTNDVVKFVKKTGDNDYFGTTITGLAGPATLTTTSKTVTLRVYSPAVGTNFLFKLEGGPGGAVVEKDVATTVANAWETLSFDLSAGAAGTYATVVIFPNGRSTVAADKTMYIDELKFPAAGGGGGGSGSTGTCTDTACIDFSEPGIGFGPFENGGGGTVAIVNDPSDAANKIVQFVKKPGDGDYFGTTITGLGGSVVLTSTEKTVTMRVYSPAAGTNFLLKFEGGTGGPATTEKDAATTVAGAWETLSFVMPDAGTYSVVVLFPNGRSQVAADKTMYVDELRFPAFSTGGGGSGCGSGGAPADMGSGGPQTMVLSSGDSKGIFVAGEGIFAIDYKGSLESNGNCGSFVEAHSDGTPGGGNIGYFNDAPLSTSGQKIDEGGWIVGTSLDPGGIPNFFRYFVLTAPAATFNASYMGLYANAPNDGTLNVQAFSKIKFRLWGPAEMYQQANFNPVLEMVLSGPKVAGCNATGSGGTEITQSFTANQKIGAGSAYTLPLSGFTVKGLCGSDTAGTAVAAVLSTLSRVTVTVPPTSFNFTNANAASNPVSYSTGVNLGPIGFTNN